MDFDIYTHISFIYRKYVNIKEVVLFNDMIGKLLKFYNKNKLILAHFCFGILLLWNLVTVPLILKKIVSIMHHNKQYINPFSKIWYEQSREAMLFFEQQNINLLMACSIMASLLYHKHKMLAFLCLIIPSLYKVMQKLILN